MAQNPLGENHFTFRLFFDFCCQWIVNPKLHQKDKSDFCKAAFMRREAALVSEPAICGVLRTEKRVPLIATNRH